MSSAVVMFTSDDPQRITSTNLDHQTATSNGYPFKNQTKTLAFSRNQPFGKRSWQNAFLSIFHFRRNEQRVTIEPMQDGSTGHSESCGNTAHKSQMPPGSQQDVWLSMQNFKPIFPFRRARDCRLSRVTYLISCHCCEASCIGGKRPLFVWIKEYLGGRNFKNYDHYNC